MNRASAAQSADECQKHVFHELWSCRGHFQPARRALLLYETAYQSKLNDFAHRGVHLDSGCCTRAGSSFPTAAAHTNTAQVTKKRAFLDGIKPPPKIKLSFRLLLLLSTHIQKSAVFFTPDPPQARFGSLMVTTSHKIRSSKERQKALISSFRASGALGISLFSGISVVSDSDV